MDNSREKQEGYEGLQVWKVIGVFAMVFLAVQLVVAFLGVSINAIMRSIGAGENIRIFFGSTLSRAGMIAATILICAPVIRKVFQEDPLSLLYPFTQNWLKDVLGGIIISGCVIALMFAIMLVLNQITVDRMALSGQPLVVWLRAIWLAILVNTAAAAGEEVIFRGLLLTGLKKAWDAAGAIFISAVIFGASHVLVAGARESNWLEFIPLLALPGVMLGWAFLRSGNLWLATGLHFGWNLFQDDLFNLAARNKGDSLFGWVVAHNGPAWLLGNSYGIEVGLIGILSAALVGAGILLYTRKKHASDQ